MNRILLLEDGTIFEGTGFGADNDSINELVFNTSCAGYQEILSDPSYARQFVVMTYPLIGNYGINEDDFESKSYHLGGFIVKEYNDRPSNFRSTKSLDELLKEHNIPGISGIDTRYLTRIIRDKGSMKAMITTNKDVEKKVAKLKEYDLPSNLTSTVSCTKPYFIRIAKPKYTVVAIDCGIKRNILRSLSDRKCNIVVVPYNTPTAEILKYRPDGIFISNGPGDPTQAKEVIQSVNELRGKVPMFGICFGHQVMALSCNAKVYKMKFGHRGSNHPVMNLATGKVEITSQNHSYAVENKSTEKADIEVTHINILDNEVEGIKNAKDKLFSVQYHPESCPGPEDSKYLFDDFIKLMKDNQEG